MRLFKTKRDEEAAGIKIPRHIAIIMDGNGRWATRRGLPRSAGHAAGAETCRTIFLYCKSIGVKYLTVYAFSTENWKRAKNEVDGIMRLLKKYLGEGLETFEKYESRIKFFGDMTLLSPELRDMVERVEEYTAKFTEYQLNICLNYGSRDEIVRAAIEYAKDYAETGKALDEAAFSDYLYSAGVPDPDMVIRPSGEYRISNFLLWQMAYSELYFTDILWPDFTPEDIDRAIEDYSHRVRLYGGNRKNDKDGAK